MKFWRSHYPFCDFAVLSFRNTEYKNNALSRLRSSDLSFYFNISTPDSGEATDCIFIYPDSDEIKTDRIELLFSGTAISSGGMLIGYNDIKRASGINNLDIGQFSQVSVGKDGVTAKTDVFGHGQVFTYSSNSYSLISNRCHLLAMIIKEIGDQLYLNKNIARTFLLGDSVLFSQQLSADECLTEGVSLMRPDKVVTLKDGNAIFYENTDFTRIFAGLHENHSIYVDEGVSQLVDICKSVIEDNRFSKVLVDLSGGKDSRMVFAAVNQVNNWRDKCRIVANHVPNSQDLEIACGLVDIFNASFNDGTPIPKIPLTLNENTDIWRSYFFGLYHRMGAFGWSHRGENLSTVNLSGGNGEAARGFWSKIFERQISEFDLDNVSIEDVAAKIVRSCFNKNLMNTDDVIEQFSSTLESMPRTHILDKLDLHYIYFRNRAHFGMRAFSSYSTQQTVFPLLSPSLVKAAWSLSPSERISKKIISETLNRMNPVWTAFAFDKGEVLDGPLSKNLIGILSDTSSWQEAKQREDSIRKSEQGRALMRWSDWPGHLKEEALSVAQTAIESGIVSEQTVIEKLDKTDTRSGREFASKIFAIHDAVNP